MRSVITISDAAADRIKGLMAQAREPAVGVRLSTPKKGCNGLSYDVAYVSDPKPGDELVEAKGVKVFVDPMSVLFLIGSEMDWAEDDFTAGFTFRNPNEKGRCGCGESFNV
jgi:iron-sulfur cluster assembly protein